MKGHLIAIFLTALIISGLITNGIVVCWELNKIEAPFSKMVYMMYLLPFAISYGVANIYKKVWERNSDSVTVKVKNNV